MQFTNAEIRQSILDEAKRLEKRKEFYSYLLKNKELTEGFIACFLETIAISLVKRGRPEAREITNETMSAEEAIIEMATWDQIYKEAEQLEDSLTPEIGKHFRVYVEGQLWMILRRIERDSEELQGLPNDNQPYVPPKRAQDKPK